MNPHNRIDILQRDKTHDRIYWVDGQRDHDGFNAMGESPGILHRIDHGRDSRHRDPICSTAAASVEIVIFRIPL